MHSTHECQVVRFVANTSTTLEFPQQKNEIPYLIHSAVLSAAVYRSVLAHRNTADVATCGPVTWLLLTPTKRLYCTTTLMLLDIITLSTEDSASGATSKGLFSVSTHRP